MFRCPTCVGILEDPEVSSCPYCGQRFRGRKRPIELGQETRITTRMSAVEHAMLERRSHAMHVSSGSPSPAEAPPLVEPERPDIDLGATHDVDLTGGAPVDVSESDADAEPAAGGVPATGPRQPPFER